MSSLAVLLVEDDGATADLVATVLRPWNDALQVTGSADAAMDALPAVDVALVDLEVQAGAGLALVHFFRARDPELAIVALIPAGDAESETVAHALGVNATVSKPLTGDALLVALSPIREKKAVRVETVARRGPVPLASVLEASDLHALAQALASTAALLTGAGARAVLDDGRGNEIEARAGESNPDDALPLVARDDTVGTLHVCASAREAVATDLEALGLAGGSVGALLRHADAIARVGIKDPETSAYTFSYFVDVAGREMERARRYDRRFGLLTFLIENYAELREGADPELLREARRELVDTILDTVRDSDVLAHVEDDEMYLLLPETGRLGALSCRRRIAEKQSRRSELARLEGRPSLQVSIGVASFPQDGRDLTPLLRAAQKRGHGSSLPAAVARDARDGLEALLGALLRFRPDEDAWQIRQAAMPAEAIVAMASAVAREATRGAEQDGVMYLVGDRTHPLVRGGYEAARTGSQAGLPSYWLRPRAAERNESSSQGVRLSPVEIEIDGARVGPFVLLVVLTEGWAYACVSSDHGEYKRVMHTSDVELVEALVAELQQTFHLQRGLE
jgi:diguanylate cyclase (GGDEF)-like protein